MLQIIQALAQGGQTGGPLGRYFHTCVSLWKPYLRNIEEETVNQLSVSVLRTAQRIDQRFRYEDIGPEVTAFSAFQSLHEIYCDKDTRYYGTSLEKLYQAFKQSNLDIMTKADACVASVIYGRLNTQLDQIIELFERNQQG